MLLDYYTNFNWMGLYDIKQLRIKQKDTSLQLYLDVYKRVFSRKMVFFILPGSMKIKTNFEKRGIFFYKISL